MATGLRGRAPRAPRVGRALAALHRHQRRLSVADYPATGAIMARGGSFSMSVDDADGDPAEQALLRARRARRAGGRRDRPRGRRLADRAVLGFPHRSGRGRPGRAAATDGGSPARRTDVRHRSSRVDDSRVIRDHRRVSAAVDRLPPRRSGFRLWTMRFLGVVATGALLAVGATTSITRRARRSARSARSRPAAPASTPEPAVAKDKAEGRSRRSRS